MFHFTIYVLIVLAGISLIAMILRLLVSKKLNETNAILWILIGFLIILSGIFPKLVVRLSRMLYITYPPAFIFTIAIIILLFIVLRQSIHITELTAKVQDSATEVSILKYEMEGLKKLNNINPAEITEQDEEGYH